MKKITARAPATVANLNVGFDQLALAIEGLYDEITLVPNQEGKWRITSIENGDGIPTDPTKNVCTIATELMRQVLNDKQGYDVAIKKGYQAGSGLGSSAASAVAALWAYNAVLDFPLTRQEIIRYAMKSEEYVSGKAIADNVAACALGGIVLIRSDINYDFVSLPIPNLVVGCLLPDVQVITKTARDILPQNISLEMSTRQSANMAGFIHALHTADVDLMKRAMIDITIEQHRAPLIPHFHQVKKIAMDNGAISFGIGGSGPAVFYFCEDAMAGSNIASAISEFWRDENIKSVVAVGRVNNNGVQII